MRFIWRVAVSMTTFIWYLALLFQPNHFLQIQKQKGLTLQARGYWGPKKSFFRAFTFEWPGPRLRETFQQISSSTTFPRHLGMSCPSITNIMSRKNIIKIRLQGRRQRPFERGLLEPLNLFFLINLYLTLKY